MSEIRLLNEDEIEEAVKLADSTFRDSEHKSMGEAFPYLFSNNLKQSFGAFEHNQLIAFMGLVPAVIHINEARLYTYSLGAVCTHPDFRNKGYADQILQEVKKFIDTAGASLMLVSGDRSLYTRNNCFRFGTIHHFTLQDEFLNSISASVVSANLHIREMEQSDLFHLYEAVSSQRVRYEQSVWDLAGLNYAEAYGSIHKLVHKVLVSENRNGSVNFVIIAVPENIKVGGTPFVIESAGDPDAVIELLHHAYRKYNLFQLDIAVCWHEKELISRLQSLPYQIKNNQGTLHIVNLERLLIQLIPLLQQKNTELSNALQFGLLEDGTCHISLNEDSFINVTPDELVSLLFDVDPVIEMDPRLKEQLSKLFPIPFPYTAGLNYV